MIIRFTIPPSGFISREFSTNCLLFLIKPDTYKKGVTLWKKKAKQRSRK